MPNLTVWMSFDFYLTNQGGKLIKSGKGVEHENSLEDKNYTYFGCWFVFFGETYMDNGLTFSGSMSIRSIAVARMLLSILPSDAS